METRGVSSFKRGMILVLSANILNLIVGLINGFVLPKVLSVEAYADIKSYQLYISFVGVIAMGYADGLYLKYGGRQLSSIMSDEISICRGNLMISQLIGTAFFVLVSVLLHNQIVFFFAISILPLNVVTAYRNLFQATGEFAAYSRSLNYTSIITFLLTLTLLYIVKTTSSIYYILAIVLVDYIILLMLELKLNRVWGFKFKLKPLYSDFRSNIKSGFLLMLGNFSNILISAIDRWFVELLLSVQDFAFYSFVVSTENLINVFMTPIITTMYNFICQNENRFDLLRRIKKMCIIFALFLISSAYPLVFILEHYLDKYSPAQQLVFILFPTEVFYMVIKGVYVNVYKANKQQSKYFQQMCIVIVVGIVLNFLMYFVFGTNEGIAVATLISSIVWYMLCGISIPELKPDRTELCLLSPLVVFWITSLIMGPIGGFFVYIVAVFLVCLVFDKDDFLKLFDFVLSFIRNNKIRR